MIVSSRKRDCGLPGNATTWSIWIVKNMCTTTLKIRSNIINIPFLYHVKICICMYKNIYLYIHLLWCYIHLYPWWAKNAPLGPLQPALSHPATWPPPGHPFVAPGQHWRLNGWSFQTYLPNLPNVASKSAKSIVSAKPWALTEKLENQFGKLQRSKKKHAVANPAWWLLVVLKESLGCPSQYHGVSGPTLATGTISEVHGMCWSVWTVIELVSYSQSCSDCVNSTHYFFNIFFRQLPNGLSHPSTKQVCHIQPSTPKKSSSKFSTLKN